MIIQRVTQKFVKVAVVASFIGSATIGAISFAQNAYAQNADESNLNSNSTNATNATNAANAANATNAFSPNSSNAANANGNSGNNTANNAANSAATPVKGKFYGKVVTQVSESTSSLINNAMRLIGVRYRWGEQVQTGFDASAFVKYVLKDNLGFLFPVKTTDDMSKVGAQVSRDSLKPGDLVFFNTLQRENSHVGIYVGENKFIHSPARGSGVRVDDMTTLYWNMRFDGARRVQGGKASLENLVNQ